MEPDNKLSKIDKIILAFFKGGITAGEKAHLNQWLNSDLANKDNFRQLYMLWKTIGIARSDNSAINKAFITVNDSISIASTESTHKNSKQSGIYLVMRSSLLKWAAVIVISLCTGALLNSVLRKPTPNQLVNLSQNEIIVPLGSKSRIVLPDKTEVWLNAGSRLTYPVNYGQTLREVNLTGEGYFKVAKMADNPFIVHTSRVHIKAMGTEFNVKAYPEEKVVETILVKGVVAVRKTLEKEDSRDFTLQNSVVLKPGQKIQIYKETMESKRNQLVENKKIDPAQNEIENLKSKTLNLQASTVAVETSWKESRWIIEGTDLNQLFVELGRRFNVSITLASPELKRYQFSGIIQSETLEQVFNLMSLTIPLSYTIDKGKVEIKLNQQLESKYQRAYHL